MSRFLLGLGNPGSRYAGTRHNFGFMLADLIAGSRPFRPGKGQFYIAQGPEITVVKPTTYMNLSGVAALQLAQLFGVEPRDMLVAYDEIDIPFGSLRLRLSGGPGTHKGIQSVIYHLGTEDIPRIRLGIGPKPPGVDLSEFVLSPFTPEESRIIPDVLSRAEQCVFTWLRDPQLALSSCGKVWVEQPESGSQGH